jgi:two-component system KDP operon response regulator KdpE
MAKILVIDDEKQIRRFLKISLESYGHNVVIEENGKDGLNSTINEKPDLIILDLQLPDMNGLEFLKEVRQWSDTPIIVLTVRDFEDDKISLLENGADDYLTKPFSVGELNARIKVALRKTNMQEKSLIFKTGELEIDYSKRIVKISKNEIKLTPTEYNLLSYLSKNLGKVITHNQILKELWGETLSEETQYLRTYVMQLRKKIEVNPAEPQYIITESGVGYRLKEIGE